MTNKQIPHKQLTIVIKLGSSSLVDEVTKEPKLSIMSKVVETVVKLRRDFNHRVIIVSSGGIAVGLKTMNLSSRPKQLQKVQAIAAIGQSKLIGRWDSLFQQFDQTIAQILLTRNDIADWSQYKNAQNTMEQLLHMDVVPIINENDTLSVSEIKFGDNDTLSAITAGMCGADYLFLLTDVDCLYNDNPRINQDAKPVFLVKDMNEINGVDVSSGSGSDVGTGGMSTKLIAADLATCAGVHTIITKSEDPTNIYKIVRYVQKIDNFRDKNIESQEITKIEKGEVPLHTLFLAQDNQHQVKSRTFWILHGLITNGALIIDQGAYNALTRKNKAGLLPAGVLSVEGTFHESECVLLKLGTRNSKGELDNTKPIKIVGRARVNYTSQELNKIKGLQSSDIEKALGYVDTEYVAHRENLAFPPH
ncbi:probable Glutamate 5-kinase [Saccharomycodes ludwigii]|uniref:Probable Glutamate 5-kinase n=1 Tax=Saccharomycodes ludwigii TaxID=36035 RepID=A0A376B6D5_9ASCO|nr:probable Glutamate 5-kinase [Saccharomycodes ludwigii]